MELNNQIFKPKELRDQALTVRLPKSVSGRLREICSISSRSQSEVIEYLINDLWEQISKAKKDEIGDSGKSNEKI
jgi:predicted transcriptional regulator